MLFFFLMTLNDWTDMCLNIAYIYWVCEILLDFDLCIANCFVYKICNAHKRARDQVQWTKRNYIGVWRLPQTSLFCREKCVSFAFRLRLKLELFGIWKKKKKILIFARQLNGYFHSEIKYFAKYPWNPRWNHSSNCAL